MLTRRNMVSAALVGVGALLGYAAASGHFDTLLQADQTAATAPTARHP